MKISYNKFKDYEKQWVAIDTETDNVFDADNNVADLQKRLEKSKRDIESFVLFFVPSFHTYFVG